MNSKYTRKYSKKTSKGYSDPPKIKGKDNKFYFNTQLHSSFHILKDEQMEKCDTEPKSSTPFIVNFL